MADFSTKIEAARKEGYSDDEILSHLSSGDLAPKIQAAQKEGYSSPEILAHLGKAKAEPNALVRGADVMLEGLGTTAEALGAETVGKSLKGAIETPETPSASEKFVNRGKEGFDWSSLPEAVVEQIPQYAGGLAARGTGAAIGSAFGPIGAGIGAFAGPGVLDFAQSYGPNVEAHARNAGRTEPNWEDKLAAGGTSLASAALASAGLAGPSGALKRTALDAGTNYLQGIVQQQGTGGEISNKEALGQTIIGAPAAAGVQGTVNTTAKAGKALAKVTAGEPIPEHTQVARTSLANRLQTAKETGANLRDATGSRYENETRAALDDTHIQVSEEIKSLQSILRPRLSPADATDFDSIIDTATANAGLRGAKNKLKNTVSPKQRATIERMVGDTQEGAELIKRLDESDELTRLYKKGLTGGVSQYTDRLNPLSRKLNDQALSVAAQIAATGALPGIGNLAAPALQLGAVGAGRMVDAVTGRRYPVDLFVKENKGPVEPPEPLPSIAAERARQKAEAATQKAQGSKERPPVGKAPRAPRAPLEVTLTNPQGPANPNPIRNYDQWRYGRGRIEGMQRDVLADAADLPEGSPLRGAMEDYVQSLDTFGKQDISKREAAYTAAIKHLSPEDKAHFATHPTIMKLRRLVKETMTAEDVEARGAARKQ